MQTISTTTSGSSDEPPSRRSLCSLKEFHSAGRGFWSQVPDSDWEDWHWQLKHRITSLEQLQRLMPALTPEEVAGATLANHKLALAITPYFFNLIDPADEDCPIRWQVIPRVEETLTAPWEMSDPCGEDSHSPVPGLVHRYPDRVLFLVTDRCASYCRYCTRSRLVSNASGYDFHPEFDRQIEYIRRHPASPRRAAERRRPPPVERREARLSAGPTARHPARRVPPHRHPHPHFPAPAHYPATLRRPQAISSAVHQHPLQSPRELTTEARDALGRLADAGIPLGNQSVLLRKVNDDPAVMKAHVQKLLICRVKPYYLYQCDLIAGSAHLRASVRKGLEIMESLRGHTTGYAVPQYVIDAPNGGGKVPINPDYILSRNADRVVIRNYQGAVFEYPEAQDGTPLTPAPRHIQEPELV